MNTRQTYRFYRELKALKDAVGVQEERYLEKRRQHPEHLSPEMILELIEHAERGVHKQYAPLRRAIEKSHPDLITILLEVKKGSKIR